MQLHTVEILTATLKADNTIADNERKKILKVIRGEPLPASDDGNGKHPQQKIYSREQVAEQLGGRTTRFVDKLCRAGLLEKFRPRGHRRAIGITAKSLSQFLTEGGN
ncbi:MAG: hypothetical protein ABSB84_15070 [Verrucomicrobiota bacterium]|jgi:hypothetical protein